jgi:hypothetical protein
VVILGTLLLALFFLVLGLLVERWRGQYALSRWKERMGKQGEIFEAERIWPRPSLRALAFSNELCQACDRLPRGLNRYAGRISPLIVQQPGIASRGSQEPSPSLENPKDPPGTWQDLQEQIRQAQPALQLLRTALKNPPADPGYEILPRLESCSVWPNFVGHRRAAQALQAAVLSDLHKGDLEGAKENLVALAAFSKLAAEEPTLVSYMIRIAILGLSTEVAWDALQADGWTEGQLAALQQAFRCDHLLAQMPRAMEGERATWLFELDWFKSHSYGAWVARFEPLYQSFGLKLPDSGFPLAFRYYREWIFHPLWRFAWADQEKLVYLQNEQRELELLREACRAGSWKQVRGRVEAIEKDYHPPSASWRFYLAMPLLDQMAMGGPADKHQYPYPVFARAWSTAMKNLTLCHMLTTAIGLKRYELRHGKRPANLDALVPEFVDEVPRDLMDGRPLRYKIRPDGTACLYSVGDDAEDNLGDPTPQTSDHQRPSAWEGRDWVWPHVVSAKNREGE